MLSLFKAVCDGVILACDLALTVGGGCTPSILRVCCGLCWCLSQVLLFLLRNAVPRSCCATAPVAPVVLLFESWFWIAVVRALAISRPTRGVRVWPAVLDEENHG